MGGTEADTSENSETEEDIPKLPSRLYWADLKPMLSEKLNGIDFTNTIRQLSQNAREAGSEKDENLAYLIENKFHELKLSKVWRDEHYVKIQVKGSSAQNSVTTLNAKGEMLNLGENPEGYV